MRAGERVPIRASRCRRGTPGPGVAATRDYGYGEKLARAASRKSLAGLPTSALADEILLEGEGRIRALLVSRRQSSGRVARSDARRMRDAGARAERDVRSADDGDPNVRLRRRPEALARVAGDHACSSGLERPVAHGYPAPYAQYAETVVDPPAGSEVIEEWEFFYGLGQRMGLGLTCYPIRAEAGVLRGWRDAFTLDMRKKALDRRRPRRPDERLAGSPRRGQAPSTRTALRRGPCRAPRSPRSPSTRSSPPPIRRTTDRLESATPTCWREPGAVRAEPIRKICCPDGRATSTT